uniref:VPS9 domain-containing protein n=1 Tax=Candidozyma auris TaxID=498019 RepID=A0A0L0NZP0_CANAR
MSILKAISTEVHENVSGGIHPSVLALVDAFIMYLKEPRYLNPLGLAELSQLFANFYADLNSLVIYIYTQLNSNKRQLLQNSAIFQNDQKTFDYLVALSQYSTLSIKRLRRTDPHALFQLRVFALYKFMTIVDTIEKAQYDLFNSSSPGDKSTLFDKIFRFDEKDIRAQQLWTEKIKLLKNLNLPLSSFCESQNDAEAAKLDEYFLTLDTSECATLQEIKKNFKLLNIVKTPSTKLKYLVNTQKLIVRLLSNFYNDASKVNNDILLPALIYIIIYHLPEDVPENPELETVTESYDLLLNITFIKNFLNVIDAHKVDITTFTLNTSLSSYKPTGKKRPFSRGDRRNSSTNLYDLINLKESAECEPVDDDEGNLIYSTKGLQNDKALIDYIQKNFLNHGELQYYLTNFEAVIYFLLNSTLDELVPDGFLIPESSRDHKLVTKPLHKILEEEFASAAMKDKSDVDADKLSRTLDEELDANRSRSGSLFNTISSAVQSSVNRSRSNSGAIKSNKESNGHNDFENSLYGGPLGNNEAYGFGRMKNILGKLGSSAIQFRQGFEEELNSGMLSDPQVNETRQKRASTLFDKLSPNHTRMRSESLDAVGNSSNPLVHTHSRKPTLSLKFSTAASEFMTKFSAAANNPTGPAPTLTSNPGHASNPSLHSLEEQSPFEERPPIGERSASLHTMDRWFNNFTNEESAAIGATNASLNHQSTSSAASNAFTNNEDSVFSSSAEELTKFQHIDFDSLTINDLKLMKNYYDQLCSEFIASKTDSKTSNEYLPLDAKDQPSI